MKRSHRKPSYNLDGKCLVMARIQVDKRTFDLIDAIAVERGISRPQALAECLQAGVDAAIRRRQCPLGVAS